MPVSAAKKTEVRDAATTSYRAYQATRATGILLYNDGNYGDIIYGHSGNALSERKLYIVTEHHNNLAAAASQLTLAKKKPKAFNLAYQDAEVNVFNSAGRECLYWGRQNITPTEMYIYIIGPHDMCISCKKLMRKFAQEFGINIANIEVTFHQTAH
ncbi:hypothetical protein ACVW0Y_002276 [Pseudomonas sp. TE3786]